MSDQTYWDEIAREWDAPNQPLSTWRRFCDALNVRAFSPWLEGCAGARALKTDLFDEANGSRALCDLLDAHAAVVAGIDVSREMGARARRRHGLSVVAGDVRERGFWKDYMRAYEDAIRATATDEAPWYVVPADNKWFTRVVVGAAIIDALGSLDLHYPRVGKEQRKALAVAQRALLAEK